MRLLAHGAASPRLALVLLGLAVGACSNDVTAPAPAPTATNLTVDASTATAFVSLGATPRVVTGADTTTATGWDIAFNATNVMINSGGGITAYCLCTRESATDAAVMAMTPTSEASVFDEVDASDASVVSTSDAFTAHKWYRYNLTGNDHQVWPTFNVYLIKRGTALYKLQIVNYYGANAAPRQIAFRVAQLRS